MTSKDIDLNEAPEDLTSEQREAIAEFKADGLWEIGDGETYQVQENEVYLKSDWTASRFLKARDWDVKKARSMFHEHLRTRKRLNMSQLIDEFSVSEEEAEAVRKYCPQYWLGTDCDGRPVYIQCFTYLDGKKLFEGISEDTVLKAQAYTCECLIREILPACSKAAGKPIRQTASLIDFNDVSYSQLWTARDFAKNYLAFQEANYPDYLGRSYVINAPHALTIVWSMAQKILPKATVEKVQILGHDYHDQLNIPKESLPTEYGGTRGDEWKFSGPPNLNAVLLTSPEQHADTRIRSSDSKNRKAQARDAKSSSSESSVASFDTAPVANYS